MALPMVDLYLARGFIHYHPIWAQLAARGANADAAEEAWMRVVRRDSHRFEDQTLANHTKWFGPPASVTGRTYCWSLELWPDHLWSVEFGEAGWPVTKIGVVRRAPGQPQRVSPLSVESANAALQLGYDGVDEIERALGAPDDADGWWPEDYWIYDLPDGTALRCWVVHALLARIDHLPGRPASL